MRLSDFRVDPEKVKEGVVRKFDVEGKCYVRVARMNNPKFEAEMRRLSEPYKTWRKSKVPEDVQNEIAKKAMAKFILLEMVGFEDDFGEITGTKGAVIEDTFENRLKVLMNKNYDTFLEMVSTISLDFDSFKSQTEDEELGNSPSPSDGSGHGDEKSDSSGSSNG